MLNHISFVSSSSSQRISSACIHMPFFTLNICSRGTKKTRPCRFNKHNHSHMHMYMSAIISFKGSRDETHAHNGPTAQRHQPIRKLHQPTRILCALNARVKTNGQGHKCAYACVCLCAFTKCGSVGHKRWQRRNLRTDTNYIYYLHARAFTVHGWIIRLE